MNMSDGCVIYIARPGAPESAESTSSAPATERAAQRQPTVDDTRRVNLRESDTDMISLDADPGTIHDTSEAGSSTAMLSSCFPVLGQETTYPQLPTAQMQAAAALPDVIPDRPITSPHAHGTQFAACAHAVAVCNTIQHPSATAMPLTHNLSAEKSIAPTIGTSVSPADAQSRRTRRRRREMQSTYRVRQNQRAQELARMLNLPINTQLHTLAARTIAQIIGLQARAGLPISQLPQIDDNFEN